MLTLAVCAPWAQHEEWIHPTQALNKLALKTLVMIIIVLIIFYACIS